MHFQSIFRSDITFKSNSIRLKKTNFLKPQPNLIALNPYKNISSNQTFGSRGDFFSGSDHVVSGDNFYQAVQDCLISDQYISQVNEIDSVKLVNKESKKNVTIWGAGNIGYATFLDLIFQNAISHKAMQPKLIIPRASKRAAKQLAPIHKTGYGIYTDTLKNESFKIPVKKEQIVSGWNIKELNDTIDRSDIIFLTIPDIAEVRQSIIKKLLSCNLNNKTLVFSPAGEGGVFEIARQLSQKPFVDLKVLMLETAPYGARVEEKVNSKRKSQVGVAVFPVNKTDEAIQELNTLFPLTDKDNERLTVFKPVSPLKIIFSGMNYIFHVAPVMNPVNLLKSIGTIFPDSKYHLPKGGEDNQARDERVNRSYNHYLEGVTPDIAKIMEALDEERIEIGKAYGVELTPLNLVLDNHYNIGYHKSYYEAFQACRDIYKSRPPLASHLSNHRFIIEDLPSMFVIRKLAKVAHIDTPATDAVLEMALWNAKVIGTPSQDLEGYNEAISAIPNSAKEVVKFLNNPQDFKLREPFNVRLLKQIIPF